MFGSSHIGSVAIGVEYRNHRRNLDAYLHKVRLIKKDTKVYAKYQVVKHSEIILFFYLHIALLSGS